MSLYRSLVTTTLSGLLLGGCGRLPDPIVADVVSARDRTVPAAGRLVAHDPLQRNGRSAQASWEIETDMSWRDYAAWVEPRLAEYRLAERDGHRLRFARQLEGDLYSLLLVAKAGPGNLEIEASFEAMPF